MKRNSIDFSPDKQSAEFIIQFMEGIFSIPVQKITKKSSIAFSVDFLDWYQGDQVGRIFAYLAIVYFRQVFRKLQKEPKKYVATYTKSGLGFLLGDFFTNSSDHPDWYQKWLPTNSAESKC
jgi:hypothetical protein